MDEKYKYTILATTVGLVNSLIDRIRKQEDIDSSEIDEYNVNECIKNGMTPLLYAIIQKDIALVRLLLDHGANPNFTDNELIAHHPLILAAQYRHFKIAILLIERGANINICDYSGKTALIYFTKKCHIEMITFLLKKGADIYISDRTNNTALMYSRANRSISIFQSYVNKSNRKEILIYTTAVKMCQPTSIETKIGKFAKVSARARRDWLMHVSSFLSEDVTTTKL